MELDEKGGASVVEGVELTSAVLAGSTVVDAVVPGATLAEAGGPVVVLASTIGEVGPDEEDGTARLLSSVRMSFEVVLRPLSSLGSRTSLGID